MDKELLKAFVAGQVRHLVGVAAGSLIGVGALSGSDKGQFIEIGSGLVMWVIVAVWSWWQKDGQAQVQAALKRVTARGEVAAAVKTANAAPPGAAVKLLAAFLLAGLMLTMLAAPGHAAPLPQPGDPLAKIMADISAVRSEVVAGVIADINAADADASVLANPNDPTSFKDPISHACYPAAVKFLQSLPTAAPPSGKFVLVQLFQKKRDFVAQIKAGLPVYLKLGCSPLLGDEVSTFVTLMGMVGVKVIPTALTALMPALAPITLPALALTP